MVLLGSGMNIFSFQSDTTVGQTATFQSGQVNLNDRSTETQNSDLSDIVLQGTDPAARSFHPSDCSDPGRRTCLLLARAVQAASERAAYALSAHWRSDEGDL